MPGDTDSALPGVVRVGIAGASVPRLSIAATAGYGYTEPQGAADGAHHRMSGSAAVAVTPIAPVSFAMRFDERYDLHPDDGGGAHGGAVGDPRLVVRAGAATGSFHLGGELGAWFVGSQAPSIDFGATTLDARLLAAWTARSGVTIAAMAGYRLDNSRNAIDHPERLRFGDRIALGLSGFDAALAGVAVDVPVGRTEILGELSGDVLVGSGAPAFTDSPLRVTAGVRQKLGRALSLELRAEASLSGRPDVGPTAPLVPIEPRVSVFAGIRYTLPFQDEGVKLETPSSPVNTAQKPAGTEQKQVASTVVRITGEDGNPIPDAKVEIRVGTWSHPAELGPDGGYHVSDVPKGDAVVAVTAEGFVATEQHAPIGEGPAAVVDVRLTRATPSGQLRGLVRSFGGKGLAASVRVEPIGSETKAGADGVFTIDIPPGDYQVVVRAPHYKEQKRKIHVDENGVTILNAELFEVK